MSLWLDKKDKNIIAAKVSYSKNRDAVRARERAKYAADPTIKNHKRYHDRYGITVAQRDALFEAQGKKCAICGSADQKSKSGWHTDHDHKTGKVRGILCQPCNLMLGAIDDDKAALAAAIKYLENSED